MASGRWSWLPPLPAFITQLLSTSRSTSSSSTTEREVAPIGDPTPSVPITNPLERLESELMGYLDTLTEHRKKFQKVQEELGLLQTTQERQKQRTDAASHSVRSVPPATAAKELNELAESVEKADEPYLVNLLNKTAEAKDLTANIQLCDQAITLISELNVGISKLEQYIEAAQKKNAKVSLMLSALFVYLLTNFCKLPPELIPRYEQSGSGSDRDLYHAFAPVMEEHFFKWLDQAKVDLIKAEQHAIKFLATQKANTEAASKSTAEHVDESPVETEPEPARATETKLEPVKKTEATDAAVEAFVSGHESALVPGGISSVAHVTSSHGSSATVMHQLSQTSAGESKEVSPRVKLSVDTSLSDENDHRRSSSPKTPRVGKVPDFGGFNITPDDEEWGSAHTIFKSNSSASLPSTTTAVVHGVPPRPTTPK